MVTIRDVARACGVSAMTVSYVFNGKVGAVSVATRERVLQAARELNYQPNRLARGLGRRKNDAIGLVLPSRREGFFVELWERVEAAAGEAGFQVVLEVPNGEGENLAAPWPVDGRLVWAGSANEARAPFGPTVSLGETHGVAGDVVGVDFGAAARLAAVLAARRAATRWAYVLPRYEKNFRFDRRFAAWEEVAREAGKRLEALWSDESAAADSREWGRALGVELAQRPGLRRPQVVACADDQTAMAVMQGLRRGGVRVPADVAVLGFGGSDDGQWLDTELTTVRLPLAEIAARSVELLLARLENAEAAPQQIELSAELWAGETL